MTTVVTRAAKGSRLTWGEVDANFTNLNEDKVETINPTSSGTLTHSGDIVLSGSGKRITGDFSSAAVANRLMFQTSTGTFTDIGALGPNAAQSAGWTAYLGDDPTNTSRTRMLATSIDARFESGITGTGTYLPMTFYTGGSERMRIDTSGNVGINATPVISASSRFFMNGDATLVGGSRGILLNMYYHTTNFRWEYSTNAPAHGWVDIGSGSTAFLSTGNVAGAAGTAATPLERMVIDSNGNVLVKSAAGLGYGTGAGGTVTQATSKYTAVTLNKPTGQITMNSAGLAANATVNFILNNSLLSSGDVIVLNVSGGVSNVANYNVWAGFNSAGSIQVYVRNISAGSLSEALVINFAIIKGAAA